MELRVTQNAAHDISIDSIFFDNLCRNFRRVNGYSVPCHSFY